MEEYIISCGQSLLTAILSKAVDKITEYVKNKISKNKYKQVLNNIKQLEQEFMTHFKEKYQSKGDDYKNIHVFKHFDKTLVKSMILEIFEQEKIGDNIQKEIFSELKEFKVNNNENIIDILLIGKKSKNYQKFMDIFGKVFDIKKEGNKSIISIEFKEHFPTIKNIRLIEYDNKIDNIDNINCIWYFIDEENQEKNINISNYKTNNLSGMIPIINIHYKNEIKPEKIKKYDDNEISVKNLNENYINYFNNHIIDINQIDNNVEKEYYLCLIEKSIFNILMKDNEFKMEKKSKEILEKILQRIKNFVFGNKITNLVNLNDQIILYTFKKYLFNKSNVPENVKQQYTKLLKNYQIYLENRKKSSYSSFITKINNEIVLELRKKINERNMKNVNTRKKEIELIDDIDNEIDKYLILYINELKFDDEKDKNKDDKIVDELKIKFEDYYLNKASVFIHELVLNYIKETSIDYYNILMIKYYISLYKNDYYIEEEKKEEKKEENNGSVIMSKVII